MTFNILAKNLVQILQAILDIGEYFSKVSSPAEFNATMLSLTTAQKYELLTKHKVPHKSHAFPMAVVTVVSDLTGLQSTPGWCIVKKSTVHFCIVYSMFCNDPSKGYLVSKPFCIWNKKVRRQRSMSNLSTISSV